MESEDAVFWFFDKGLKKLAIFDLETAKIGIEWKSGFGDLRDISLAA